MFKILSKDKLAELQLYQEPSDRSLGYEENIAQAQMKEDARGIVDFLEGQCQNQDHFLVGYGRCDCHECIDDILRALKELAQLAD
jgi:hypothetical protein